MKRIDRKKIMVFLFILVLCLLVLLFVQCQKYMSQNQELLTEIAELSATLADREKTIAAGARDIGRLQAQLEEAVSTEEYMAETGFIKKAGVYLIDNGSQLWELKRLIAEGEEIEPGTAAAEASYRLRENLNMDNWYNWLSIGTEEIPFCGNFDGDGHSIGGKFPLMGGEDVPEAIFRTSENAKIENLQVINRMDQSPEEEISITVVNGRDCAELERNLENFPNCRVRLEVEGWNLETGKIADALRDRWERNQERDGYYVSISFYPDYGELPKEAASIQNATAPLYTLAGNEYGEIMDEALEQEDGYLRFVKMERIGELNCCSFEIGELESSFKERSYEGRGYHIILDGKWEGKEVPEQHFYIPYTYGVYQSVGVHRGYEVENVDINFDGKKDLLIHEGYSSGSGGSWANFRAIIWNVEAEQFEYYPSFPEQLVSLEFDRQRVVSNGSMGAGYETVTVYGVVDGEYVCTRELICEGKYDSEKQEYITVLSYYEMGELVKTHILSDWQENEQLSPDMNYWRKG